MSTKKGGALFIILALILALCGCGSRPELSEAQAETEEMLAEKEGGETSREETASEESREVFQETSEEKEVGRAVRLGIVPEELQGDYDQPVLASQMGLLLEKMIACREPSLADAWTTAVSGAEEMQLQRAAGAVYLLQAAELLGDIRMNGLYDGYVTEENAPWNQEEAACPLSVEETVMIPGPNGTDYTGDRKLGAIIFSYSRCSLLSHMPLMEFDAAWDYRGTEPMTREEAILAAVRLYDSFEEESVYITLEEAAGNCTITGEQIKAAPQMPQIQGDKLPLWRGVGIDNKAESSFWHGHYTRDFYEEELRCAAESGFDFFRVMLSFTTLQYPDFPEDMKLVNKKELEDLDEVILFALENGIHVQVSAFAMPGRYALSGYGNGENYTDGEFYPSEEEWEAFLAYFEMLAKRYQNIPAAYLSFELCSEWHPGDQGNLENFSNHMDRVIGVIRDISPDRLLMAGFDGDVKAAETMAKKGVAISFHSYEPRAFSYVSKETVEQYGGIPGWPVTDEDGREWSAERIYEEHIKPFRDIAQQYGVGFMVGEWGVCSDSFYEECHPDEADVIAYYKEMSELFREKGIPWNHFAMAGRNSFLWSGAISGFGRSGAEPEKMKYEYEDYDFEYIIDRKLIEAVMAG